MNLSALLTPGSTRCSVDLASKKRCLELASEILASSSESLTADEIFTSLLNRERLGSTGLGSGVGIPHCRISGADKAAAALISLSEPIDFDAIDDQPVDLICALIVPEDGDDEHLKTLGGLAALFSNSEALVKLRSSDSNQSLFQNAVELTGS